MKSKKKNKKSTIRRSPKYYGVQLFGFEKPPSYRVVCWLIVLYWIARLDLSGHAKQTNISFSTQKTTPLKNDYIASTVGLEDDVKHK